MSERAESDIWQDVMRARLLMNRIQPQPGPPLPAEVQLMLREYREMGDLLHQIRSIVNEYRSGEHWSSQGMERIGALLDEPR